MGVLDSPGYLMSEKSRLVRVKQKSKWNNLQNVLRKYSPAMSTLVGGLSYKCDCFLKLSGYLDLYFNFFYEILFSTVFNPNARK